MDLEKSQNVLWKADIPGLGHAGSPSIYRDLVIVQADGHKQAFIAAFNLKEGKQAWRVERDEITSWATRTIYPWRECCVRPGGKEIRRIKEKPITQLLVANATRSETLLLVAGINDPTFEHVEK
jgi:hypothetical protein